MQKKSLLLLAIVVALTAAAIWRQHSATTDDGTHYRHLVGSAFHTVYHIQYDDTADLHADIERVLREFDGSMSMFNDTSLITRFNRNDTTARADRYFREVFEQAGYVSRMTAGCYDMTIGPLVNLWGFGFSKGGGEVSQREVDSCRQIVGYDKVALLPDGRLVKANPHIVLDASGIAKGYVCDVVAELLRARGISNYIVEIGGEVALSGVNERGAQWSIGIQRPTLDTLGLAPSQHLEIVHLARGGVATSGNYRNFKMDGGRRQGHTIDPATGRPVQQDILSATVIAPRCITADAYATAFMVMGSERAKEVLERDTTIMAYFICGNLDNPHDTLTTFCSPRLQQVIDAGGQEP